ncbi:MAG: hypothetical protein VYE64_03675 [Planctomycetota bacterium]|nr:hypothetical protein [Planctomycetota bacterium]
MKSDPDSHPVPQPARPSRLFWIVPLGCFGLLTCCFGSFGIFGYLGYQQAYHNEAYHSAVDTIKRSAVVQRLVGSPIVIQRNPDVQAETSPDLIRITYPDSFSGPEGSGTAEIVVRIERATGESKIEAIQVTVDDQTINLAQVAELPRRAPDADK